MHAGKYDPDANAEALGSDINNVNSKHFTSGPNIDLTPNVSITDDISEIIEDLNGYQIAGIDVNTEDEDDDYNNDDN